MSNNTSASWCNNCYDNRHSLNCGCAHSSVYPSSYFPNSLGYMFPEETVYDGCEDYSGIKYPQNMYAPSYEDPCYLQAPYYYSALPRHTDYYPTLASSYWNKQQHQQLPVTSGTMVSNYPSHVISSTSNNPNSDPLNALQNLTVSAGQAGQSGVQPPSINNRMNTTMYNNSAVISRSLGSVNVQRSAEKYTVGSTQLTAQAVVPLQVTPTQQSLTSCSNLPTVITKPRVNNKYIKAESGFSQSPSLLSSMNTPHSLDSTGSHGHISGQQLLSQTLQKSSSNYLYQNSPSSQSAYNAQQAPTKLASPISVNLSGDAPRQLSSSTNAVIRPPVSVSEEEMKKVSEEVKRLKEKYLKTLKSMIENQKKYPDEEMKIFKVLRNILESPESISKPLAMKHIIKIEQYLVKAEQLLNNDSTKSTPRGSTNCQTVSIAKALISSRKSIVSAENSSNQKSKCKVENTMETMELRTISSLDLAFDEVCHQLMSTNPEILKKVQKGLVKYVESKSQSHAYFLPKRMISEESEDDDIKLTSKRRCISSVYDEDEFNHFDNIAFEDFDFNSSKCIADVFDRDHKNFTILNHDNTISPDYTLEEELNILKKEFEFETLEKECISKEWSSYDTEWNESLFFSMSYVIQTLPDNVPPIKVRIPDDYLYCTYVDWNLNLEMFQSECSIFLKFVKDNLVEEFSKINQYLQWSGVTLAHVANVYKKCILSAKSKYQNQMKIEFQKD